MLFLNDLMWKKFRCFKHKKALQYLLCLLDRKMHYNVFSKGIFTSFKELYDALEKGIIMPFDFSL